MIRHTALSFCWLPSSRGLGKFLSRFSLGLSNLCVAGFVRILVWYWSLMSPEESSFQRAFLQDIILHHYLLFPLCPVLIFYQLVDILHFFPRHPLLQQTDRTARLAAIRLSHPPMFLHII